MNIKEKTFCAASVTLFLAIVAIVGDETTDKFWPPIVGFVAVICAFFTGVLFYDIKDEH